jgi:hypothetical protein
MKNTMVKKSWLSFILIITLVFTTVAPELEAAVTREQMKKVIKWGTIGGVAISAVIGAATFGIGGMLAGAAVGALVTTLVCNRFGVAPQDQWKQVFPNFKLPFKYNRQNQSGQMGVSIPTNGPAAAPALSQKKTTTEQIKESYYKAYNNYNQAVQKSKDSGAIKKALDAYKKAKAAFDKLRK